MEDGLDDAVDDRAEGGNYGRAEAYDQSEHSSLLCLVIVQMRLEVSAQVVQVGGGQQQEIVI